MTTVTLPTDINGITEVGVAAGVDVFKNLAYCLVVQLKVTAGYPRALTPPEARALDVVNRYNALGSDDERAAFWLDKANIRLDAVHEAPAIIALIDDFPPTEAAARTQLVIECEDISQLNTQRITWEATPLHRRAHVEPDVEASLQAITFPVNTVIAQRLYQTLAAYVLHNGWFIRHPDATGGLVRLVDPLAPAIRPRTPDEVNDMGFSPMQEAANLLVALKLTWWLTNHHVGQVEDELAGFVGKVAGLQGLLSETSVVQNREVRNVLWAFGKMITTRGLLRGIGITSIVYGDFSNTGKSDGNDYAWCGNINISASPDVLLRVRGHPAGTAKTTTLFAIARRAGNSIFGVCVPPLINLGFNLDNQTFIGRAADHLAAIEADPASHHMGAHFLTGHPRTVLDTWDEEEVANLSAFIHSVASGSSLAKARVILPQPEIVGNTVYLSITNARSALASGMSDRMTVMLMSRITGGGGSGGMAAQFGKLRAEEVEEAKQILALADMGDVSDDEPAGSRENAATRAAREERNRKKAARRAARAQVALIAP